MLRTRPSPLCATSAMRHITVLVERVYKSVFLRRSRFVYCGRTQGHATAGFFVPICPHVSCRQEPGQCTSYDKKSIRKSVMRVRIPEGTWCLEWHRDVPMSHAHISTCERTHGRQQNRPRPTAVVGCRRTPTMTVPSTPINMTVLSDLRRPSTTRFSDDHHRHIG